MVPVLESEASYRWYEYNGAIKIRFGSLLNRFELEYGREGLIQPNRGPVVADGGDLKIDLWLWWLWMVSKKKEFGFDTKFDAQQ